MGCNIKLPFEQKLNPYVDHKVEFEFFFTRKVILRKNSVAYVLMPGGFGTMDEIFEVLTLIQTGKFPPRPVVCMGSDYWGHMQSFIRKPCWKPVPFRKKTWTWLTLQMIRRMPWIIYYEELKNRLSRDQNNQTRAE